MLPLRPAVAAGNRLRCGHRRRAPVHVLPWLRGGRKGDCRRWSRRVLPLPYATRPDRARARTRVSARDRGVRPPGGAKELRAQRGRACARGGTDPGRHHLCRLRVAQRAPPCAAAGREKCTGELRHPPAARTLGRARPEAQRHPQGRHARSATSPILTIPVAASCCSNGSANACYAASGLPAS